MTRLLPGTRLHGLCGEMLYAASVVAQAYLDAGYKDLWITSGIDGKHKAGSRHYAGLALDFRTKTVDPQRLPGLVAEIRAALGPDFDVILEAGPPHLHVEWDPKGA